MHLIEHLHRNVKSIAMPLGMVVGALLCRPVSALEAATGHMITPALIFAMLFFTFCRVRPSEMAAVVIGGMLGADVATMATYSLLCNMAVAFVAPVVLSLVGTGVCTLGGIVARIAPLLVVPFAAAQCCRLVLPRAAQWVAEHSRISFYMWLVSLVVVIGRTTAFIIDLRDASLGLELALALAALVVCLFQFKAGRMLGRRYGDPAAGGQSLGQKNTVLAVWMAQSFLDPISSIAPTAYIVWQNFVNSYQIWKHDREAARR